MNERFRRMAQCTAEVGASPAAFWTAIAVIFIWLVTGPLFHFSDTWQLLINTSTSVVTLLMVFLIQNTQNRDTKAIQLKLDELLRAVTSARNELVHLEDLSDEDLDKLRKEFETFAADMQSRRASDSGADRERAVVRHG